MDDLIVAYAICVAEKELLEMVQCIMRNKWKYLCFGLEAFYQRIGLGLIVEDDAVLVGLDVAFTDDGLLELAQNFKEPIGNIAKFQQRISSALWSQKQSLVNSMDFECLTDALSPMWSPRCRSCSKVPMRWDSFINILSKAPGPLAGKTRI